MAETSSHNESTRRFLFQLASLPVSRGTLPPFRMVRSSTRRENCIFLALGVMTGAKEASPFDGGTPAGLGEEWRDKFNDAVVECSSHSHGAVTSVPMKAGKLATTLSLQVEA